MDDSHKIERAAAAWLARRDAGDWCTRDQTQLDAWIAESTAHRLAWLRIASAWEQSDRLKALGAGVRSGRLPARGHWGLSPFFDPRQTSDAADSNPAWRPRAATRSLRVFRVAAVAAMLLIMVALGLVWRHGAAPIRPSFYRTAIGGHASIRLADGSEATLSSNTDMMVTLSPAERDITLRRGEAFFVVRKDAQRPFVVQAAHCRVIAVGTRFAVRHDGDDLRVVVTHGLVRLESGGQYDGSQLAQTTLLPAGSIALIDGDNLQVRRLSLPQAQEYLSWRDGFVVFHDTPLADAASEFNRYNARKIVIGDPAIAGLRVGGHFRWSNTDAFVRLLVRVFPIRVEQQDDRIVLTSSKR